MKTKEEIEATSNLIAAAKLLGGKYAPPHILLPCGRKCSTFGPRLTLLSDTNTVLWYGSTTGQRSAEGLAREIRKLVVEHDRTFH